MKTMTMFSADVDIELTATILFSDDFDPTDAAVNLFVTRFPNEPGGPGDEPPRAASMGDAPYQDVATYVTVAGDFVAGTYKCQFRVTKDGVTVNSEIFRLVVQESIA